MAIITLYHGTIRDFDVIDLKECRPYKDFGQGFYATADINHAKSKAEHTAQIQHSKWRRQGKQDNPIQKLVYKYEYDTDKAAELSVKFFPSADREWGRFITLNRETRGVPHSYDVVIGPTANDETSPTVQFYIANGLGEKGSDAAIDELVRLLLPYKLPEQYFFATQRAIDCLTLIGKEKIR
jgi:hypothetical protein